MCLSRNEVLEISLRLVKNIPGNIVEFGVAGGHSTRKIREVVSLLETENFNGSPKAIFACDSFLGLPEKFENLRVGYFKQSPPKIRGVEIVVGYFEDSLTSALKKKIGKVSFVHFDADLYSSTLCCLNWITPLLQPGTLLLFDEFYSEKESEKRAFEEWSKSHGKKIRTLKTAEFLRPPAGFGINLDARVLYQVTEVDG